MTEEEIGIIEYKEDFIVSCTINRVKPEELLQHFVNQVSYSSFLEDRNNSSCAANQIVSAFLKEGNNHVYIPKYCRSTHARCSKKLNAVTENTELSKEDKRLELSFALCWCRNEILKTEFQIDKAYLEMDECVDLSSNFLVVCFMYGIFPERLIEYFMDHISLAKSMARNQFEIETYNPFMTFFTRLSEGCFKNSRELQIAGYGKYALELAALDKGMKIEESLEQRTAKFSAFYNKWFYAIRHVPISEQGDPVWGMFRDWSGQEPGESVMRA